MKPDTLIGRLSLSGLLIIGFTVHLSATTVSADSHSYVFAPVLTKTDSGSATWTVVLPTTKDTITWKSGPNYTDGNPTPWTHTPLTEQKFAFNPLSGVTFTGFNYIDGPTAGSSPPACKPALGSCALTSGSGSSTAANGSDTANWTVTATGILGTPAIKGETPRYQSTASGADPWAVNVGELDGLTGGYSLFFTAGLDGGSVSPDGDIGFDVAYATAGGSTDLLQVLIDSTGAYASTSAGAAALGLSIYLVPPSGADPDTFVGTPLNLSQIENLLRMDLSGNTFTGPLEFGFLLNNLPIPTVDMGNRVVAQISVTSTANDQAQGTVPEPGTTALLGCGAAFLGISKLIRKKFRT